jgi:2-dehydro-3-deoxygluconokinase
LHLTGITAALSDSCYAVLVEAIARAHAAGVAVSFDVNYRAKLWTAATAGAKLRPLIAAADVLFCKGADAKTLFGCTGEPHQLIRELQALTRAPAIFCTFGDQGAALLCGKEFVTQPALAVQIVDRVGSGDCFAAGVLDGCLSATAAGKPFHDMAALREGLRRGVGMAAIALTQFGDRILTSRAELNAVLGSDSREISR